MRKLIKISIIVSFFLAAGCQQKSRQQANDSNLFPKEEVAMINEKENIDHDTISYVSISVYKENKIGTDTTKEYPVIGYNDSSKIILKKEYIPEVLRQNANQNSIGLNVSNSLYMNFFDNHIDPYYYDYSSLSSIFYNDSYYNDFYYYDDYYIYNNNGYSKPTFPIKPWNPKPERPEVKPEMNVETRPSERPIPESEKEQIRPSGRPIPNSEKEESNHPNKPSESNDSEIRTSNRPIPKSEQDEKKNNNKEKIDQNIIRETEARRKREKEKEQQQAREAEARRKQREEQERRETEARRKREEDERKQKEQQEQASSSSNNSSGVRSTDRRR